MQPLEFGLCWPSKGRAIKTVNLKSDMPLVHQALQRLDRELSLAHKEMTTLLKLIHGYGSTGAGGDIRIAAQKRADAYREVRTRFAGLSDALLGAARERFGVAAPFGGPTSSGMLTLHCPPENLQALASFLRENGADAVSVGPLDYVYTRDNALYAKLAAELDKRG